MTIPTTSLLATVVAQLQNRALLFQQASQEFKNNLQQGNVDSIWVMNFLDQMRNAIVYIDSVSSIAGLNAYATANIPNYSGTMTTDLATLRTAIVACIAWVTSNFPKDTVSGYSLAFILNADGSRTSRQFTPAQTVGLQNALQTLIQTIA